MGASKIKIPEFSESYKNLKIESLKQRNEITPHPAQTPQNQLSNAHFSSTGKEETVFTTNSLDSLLFSYGISLTTNIY